MPPSPCGSSGFLYRSVTSKNKHAAASLFSGTLSPSLQLRGDGGGGVGKFTRFHIRPQPPLIHNVFYMVETSCGRVRSAAALEEAHLEGLKASDGEKRQPQQQQRKTAVQGSCWLCDASWLCHSMKQIVAQHVRERGYKRERGGGWWGGGGRGVATHQLDKPA